MILEQSLIEKAERFCRAMNIPFSAKGVPTKYARLVEEYLIKDQKRTRKETRDNELRCGATLEKIIPGFSVLESPIEHYLYNALCDAGYKDILELQYKVGTKRVDIAIPSIKIAIEADGKAYHHTEQRQIDNDLARDKYLARKGWRVLHIEGVAIRRDIKLCVKKVKELIGT